jgi:hypothetical protein
VVEEVQSTYRIFDRHPNLLARLKANALTVGYDGDQIFYNNFTQPQLMHSPILGAVGTVAGLAVGLGSLACCIGIDRRVAV